MSTLRGHPIYDPHYLHWSASSQRHEWLDVINGWTRKQCDPATCEGCQAADNGVIIDHEWWWAWAQMWASIGLGVKHVADGWNPALDRLLRAVQAIDNRHNAGQVCPVRLAQSADEALKCLEEKRAGGRQVAAADEPDPLMRQYRLLSALDPFSKNLDISEGETMAEWEDQTGARRDGEYIQAKQAFLRWMQIRQIKERLANG